MKKLIMFTLFFALAFVGFAQDVTPVIETPWYGSTEFWVMIAGAALLIMEWIIRVVPTTKPVGFILSGIISLLKWLVNRVPNKVKEKK